MKNEFRHWTDLRTFLAVVREGSTLAASRKLGVAQPTVARRMGVLENQTGLTLFHRETRGFRPTEDARRLIPLAEAAEAEIEAFAAKARELAKPRPIRITAPGSFADRVTDIFSAFSGEHPDVEFEFLPSLRTLDLSAGEADVAFRVATDEPDERLICRRISAADWSVYGARPYLDAHGLPRSAQDLRGHQFASFQHGDVPNFLDDWLARHVEPGQIIKTFSELDLMQAYIRAGHALGLINSRMAQFDDALIEAFGPIEELARSNWMLIAPEAYLRPEVKAFVRFFAPRYAATFK